MLVIEIGKMVVVRCVAFFGARHGREGFLACLAVCAAFALLSLPLTWTINWFTLGVRGKPNYMGANIYALTVPLSMLSSLLAATLLVEGRVGMYWLNESITAGLTAVAVLVLTASGALSATTFAIGAVIAVSAALVIMSLLQTSIRFSASPSDYSLVKSVITYAFRVGVTLVPFQLTMRLDQLLISMAAPMAVLGNYAVAVAWATVLSVIGIGFSTVVLSDSARIDLASASDVEVASGRLRRAAIIVLLVGLLTCASAPIAIPLLYGSRFSAAVLPAMILSLASIPLYLNLMLHEFSRGVGLPSAGWLPETAGLAAGLLGLKILYFRFGMIGAATASFISYNVILILLLYRLSNAIELLRIRSLIPRIADLESVWALSMTLARRKLLHRVEAM
jgi:O-antigen/teichoic acid export membrane protein